MITGNGASVGNPRIRVGTILDLEGVGRVSGKYMVQRATNTVGETGYNTLPGLAVGPAFIYRDLFQGDIEHPSIEVHEIAGETARINEAVDEVLENLEETAHRIESEIYAEHAAIFSAQAEILRSGSLLRNSVRKSPIPSAPYAAAMATSSPHRRWP